MRSRKQIEQALEGLEALEALGQQFGRRDRQRPPVRGGSDEIELVEVSPGVFAAPRPARAVNSGAAPSFAARARALLRQVDEMGERVERARKEAASWRK